MGDIGSRGTSVLLFVVAVVLVIWIRPAFLVDSETGDWLSFGFGPGKTPLNITTVIMLLAVMTYLLSACVGKGLTRWKRNSSVQAGGAAVVVPAALDPSPISYPTPPPVPTPSSEKVVTSPFFGEAFGSAFSLLG